MKANKKFYEAPKLTLNGSIESLTQAGGTQFQDTPAGTPIGDGTASDSQP
jgi:hypothetical protein